MSKRCTAQLKKALRKCPPYKSITSNIDQQRAVNARIRQLRGVRTAMMKQVGGRTYKQNRAKMMSTAERKQQAFALKAPTTSTDAAANFLYQQALAAKNTVAQQTPATRDENKQERINMEAKDRELAELRAYRKRIQALNKIESKGSRNRARAKRDADEVRALGLGLSSGGEQTQKGPVTRSRKAGKAASASADISIPQYDGQIDSDSVDSDLTDFGNLSDLSSHESAGSSYSGSSRSGSSYTGSPPPPAIVGLAGVRARTDEGTAVLPLGGLPPAVVSQTVAQARRQPTNGIGGGGTTSDIAAMTPSRPLRPSANTVRRSTLGGLNSASPFLGGQPPRGGTLSDSSLLSGQSRPRPPPGPPAQDRRPDIHSDVAARIAGRRRLEEQRRLQAGRELSASTGQVSSTETPAGITFHAY